MFVCAFFLLFHHTSTTTVSLGVSFPRHVQMARRKHFTLHSHTTVEQIIIKTSHISTACNSQLITLQQQSYYLDDAFLFYLSLSLYALPLCHWIFLFYFSLATLSDHSSSLLTLALTFFFITYSDSGHDADDDDNNNSTLQFMFTYSRSRDNVQGERGERREERFSLFFGAVDVCDVICLLKESREDRTERERRESMCFGEERTVRGKEWILACP